MAIPRFQAQISTVSVPTMKDFEYEQNRSIYKTLKDAGERINDTFFKMVSEGKMGQPSGKDYQTNVKNYETAVANNIPREEIEELRRKMEESGSGGFSIFSGWGF